MRLAEEIRIKLAGEFVALRPALRHAMALERRQGGFRQLLADLTEGSLTAAIAIIEPHVNCVESLEHDVFAALLEARPALTAYVLACTGIDPDEKPGTGKDKGKPQPFNEYLTSLYRIGTGWLGWAPDTTLDATPAEITLAYEGKQEMLKAIYGSGEKGAPKDTRPLDAKFKSIFAGIGTSKEAVQ
jgi:hypothetical protein